MREFDTIAAITTPMGEGGISIIRISGSKALDIAKRIFKGVAGREVSDIKPYTMRFGYIIDGDEEIDEVILSFMKGPKSFTCEDTIEINCHGGLIATKKILDTVLKYGARSAQAGEFTKRAFLNGRIDLSQAEAVMDIINSKTEASMKSAVAQSKGRLSKEINNLRDTLIAMIAHIEATVDYPEDDMEEVTAENAKTKLKELVKRIDYLILTAEEGKLLREGLSIAIVGKPNVGKSSLLNAMTGDNRAIVTDIAGTTRDVIEEYINMDGIPVKLIDTAGIHDTEDFVEKIGVQRSKDKIKEADLVVMMIDISSMLDKEDLEIINYIKDKKYLVLLNKSDLSEKINTKGLENLDENNIITLSVKTGEGLEDLKGKIKNMFFSGEVKAGDVIISNSRHKEVLYRAKEDIISGIKALDNTFAIDLASIDLRNAWNILGEITGESMAEDLIDKIFKDFCLGK